MLEELDGTGLKSTYASSHIKRFFPQGHNLEDIQQEEFYPGEVTQEEHKDDEEDAMDQSE